MVPQSKQTGHPLFTSKLKRLLEFLAFTAFDKASLINTHRRQSDTTALVQCGLLGDYYMWLPFGKVHIEHLRREDKKIVLVCNSSWSDLAQKQLGECEILPIDRREFVRNWRYRRQRIIKLRRLGVHFTYLPNCPRDGIVEDAIVRALGAPAVGFDATFADRPCIDRYWNSRLYSRLIPVTAGLHRFSMHQLFLEANRVRRPSLPGHPKLEPVKESGSNPPYYVIAPGGSRQGRWWPIDRFVKIAQLIRENRGDLQCIILGTAGEQHLGEQISAALGAIATNLTGKTSVIEANTIISGAEFAIANDSATVHMAAYLGTPSIAIVGGGHFRLCLPYDPSVPHIEVSPRSVSHPMDCYGCDWHCRFGRFEDRSFPCIDAVEVNAVWEEVRAVLKHIPLPVTVGISGGADRN